MHVYFHDLAILGGLDVWEGQLAEVGKAFFVYVVLPEFAYQGLSRDVESFEGHDALVLLSMIGLTHNRDFIVLLEWRGARLLKLDILLILVNHIISHKSSDLISSKIAFLLLLLTTLL